MTKGGRNLVILGVCSVIVATATTGISLAVYRASGDIYLDRSRPGYLPDEEEIEEEAAEDEEETDYKFLDTGDLTSADLDAYLENLQTEYDSINAYEKPFDAESLSDETLGL